ncbi:26S protease subunit RPT4 [Paracoccidioides brasiliensis Pb18]|uniref:26S protease subunit RPT4 n=1 Tax=Paracoccidioides brasiliensis (strain Pb18) TaxID=502780 RepID=A0A0A0HUZ4_PARBD|nr:26S protease subunit RPT4 [Paracoccidioides brasiliensis Pb18]KGM92163.1 26S protease subunit RPT4 [Paracoccidioides brasiliensis Pb18]
MAKESSLLAEHLIQVIPVPMHPLSNSLVGAELPVFFIEIPLPNEVGRLEILKIHASGVAIEGEIDFESIVKMSDGLNGADLRNVVTEAGLFAIKDYRDTVNQDDFNKAVRKVAESKKLEGKLEYQKL